MLPEPWETPGPHRVSINSFGYGGSNAHIIVEDALGYLQRRGLESWYRKPSGIFRKDTVLANGHSNLISPTPRVFVISGYDESSCTEQVRSLHKYLLTKENVAGDDFMADLAFTLNECRSKFMWKTAVTGSSLKDVISSLSNNVKIRNSLPKPSLSYIFTGQGAQWVGMGKELFHLYPAFQATVLQIDQILLCLGASFRIYGM